MAVNLINGDDTTIVKTNDDITVDFSSTRSQQIDGIETDVETLTGNQLTKLWENEDPTVSFATQNITLSSSDYDYLVWFYNEGVINDDQKLIMLSRSSLKGYGVMLDCVGDEHSSGSSTYYVSIFRRYVTRNSDTSFTVTTCNYKYGTTTSWSTTDYRLVPVAVYGGKFGG